MGGRLEAAKASIVGAVTLATAAWGVTTLVGCGPARATVQHGPAASRTESAPVPDATRSQPAHANSAVVSPLPAVDFAAATDFAAPTDLAAAAPAASEEKPAAVTAVADERLLTTCDRQRGIVIYKAARVLELFCGQELAARYEASLGFAPAGQKQREGDGKTPEGEYFVALKYPSQFHRSLQINYPSAVDAARGLAAGLITQATHDTIVSASRRCVSPPQNTALGSLIQIHGMGGGADSGDWTLGCVAVDNDEIERVYKFQISGCAADGKPHTKVTIHP